VKLLRLFAAARHALPRVVPLMRDERVPLWLKVLTLAAAVVVVSPLDLFGDIPILGVLDDAALLLLLVNLFVLLAERALFRRASAYRAPRLVTPVALSPPRETAR
jgi:uncharacterized membrane protein YkvA (DUF1232 family)